MRKRQILEKMLLLILPVLIAAPSGLWSTSSYAEDTVVRKTFAQMTDAEKELALRYLIDVEGTVANTVKVDGKSYSLNLTLWRTEGLIVYGETPVVNNLVQTTASPNKKGDQWRYWGFDMNSGLYGNDNFPPDKPGTTPPQNKNWLTTVQIKGNPTARGYVGEFAVNATDRFSYSDKLATAEAFLAKNPKWTAAGKDASYILEHFYFNCVLSESGLTRGQFVGVHKSEADGNLYYQTFEIKGGTVTFVIPDPEDPLPPGPSDPTDPDPDLEEPVVPIPEPGPEVTVNCVLGMQEVTYTGHPALAQDYSVYNVDGEAFSAQRAYSEHHASNSFRIMGGGGSIRKITSVRAEATFENAGNYQVQLTASPNGGPDAFDVKPVEVKPTPAILHSLTGAQKQNRKQVINLKVAKHPDSTLTSFWVKIERLDTGEAVTLHNRMGAGANTLSNSATIKTRPIERLTLSDQYFEYCKLEFLLKNDAPADCKYTIYVKDSRGNTDQAAHEFSVSKDKPPEAAVFLEGAYIRKVNENTAEIIADDVTVTDGDQVERSWFYRPVLKDQAEEEKGPWAAITPASAGYTDYAFGTGKKIGFPKEGVGLFEVKLYAKDLWTEETLLEYVDESERLTGDAISVSEVLNVAPVVSLSPMSPKTANITFLAGGQVEYDRVKANQARLQMDLLQQGIDARITVEKMMPAASSGDEASARLMGIRTPFGYEGNWTFYEGSNYIVDNDCLYKLDATWPGDGFNDYPGPPYTVSCWDVYDKDPNTEYKITDAKWSYTFTDAVFPIPAARVGPYFTQDDSDKYLYFVAEGKTLILSKDNGSLLTKLDVEVGESCFTEGNMIYTFKSDGIYGISAVSGLTTKVYNGSVMDGKCKRINGIIHFVTGNKNKMYRGLFDPETASVKLEALDLSVKVMGNHTYRLLGIDTDGKLIIQAVVGKWNAYGNPSGYSAYAQIYGRDNHKYFESNEYFDSSSPKYQPVAVFDEAGRCNYIAFAYRSHGSTNYYVYVYLEDANSGAVQSRNVSAKNDYPTTSNVIFAKEIDGKVYICTGAEWVFVSGTDYQAYPERVKMFKFDSLNTFYPVGSTSGLGFNLATYENGQSSESLHAIQVGYNQIGNSYSLTSVLKWHQSLPQIMDRYVQKNFRGGKDINMLVIYDETNPSSSYDASLLNSVVSEIQTMRGELFMAAREDIEGGGLAESVLSSVSSEQSLLGLSVDSGQSGSLSKTFKLKPNKTYYYEYEMKRSDNSSEDIFIASHSVQNPAGAEYMTKKYFVAESLCEDFEDKNGLNPFFTYAQNRVDDGFYKGADLFGRGSSPGYYYDPYPENATAIRFTVPPDRKGLLFLEYFLQKENEPAGACSQWLANYIRVDGKVWNKSTRNSHFGKYSHPALLEPGEHEISFFASYNAHREYISKMWLDSIRVDLLSEAEEDAQGCVQEVLSAEQLPGGYVKVKGDFKTLPAAGAYREVGNAALWEGNLKRDPNPYIAATFQGSYLTRMDFGIPAGKAAILTEIQPFYFVKDRQINVQSPYSGEYNDAWYYYKDARSGAEIIMDNKKSGGIIRPGDITGTKRFTLSYSSRYGYFYDADISYTLVDSENAGWQELAHFINGTGSDKNFYLQESAYKDTLVSFRVPPGNHLVKDFSLYSIENGVKVYAEKEIFADSAKLSKWSAANANAAILQAELPADDAKEKGLVYKKNELVAYNINYFDYEGDPSKKQYWKYIHLPFNDGPHPDAAVIINDDNEPVTITGTVLGESIKRFTIDGKYIVEHWQEDNTTRPAAPSGNPDYDKLSNVENLVFYVQGGGSAPWVKSIKTVPAPVREGDNFKIKVEVDDAEKDPLQLITEVYLGKQMVYRHKKTGIRVNGVGVYPAIETDVLPFMALAGKYEIVCIVSDAAGTGIDSYKFTVISEGKITGRINHTDEWDRNRKRYNLALFGDEYNTEVSYPEYTAMKAPRKRGTNVFWSGERFLLSADVAGKPQKVTAEIIGMPDYKTELTSAGGKNPQGETIYNGELWDRTMINRWGKNSPQQVRFLFTAEYSGGITKTFEDQIIIDSNTDYWLLHRLW